MTQSYGLGAKCPGQVTPAGQVTPCDGNQQHYALTVAVNIHTQLYKH